jgi:ABC-type lipoprotein release transport system permease subunit
MKSIEGIDTIESYIGSYVPLQLGFWGEPYLKSSKGNTTSLDAFIMIIGVDPEMEAERWRIGSRMKIIDGDFLESGKEACAVIGIKFAENNGIKVGDELILPSGLFSDSNMFSFKEEVRLKIVGIYWTGTEYDKLIITDLNTLQRGLGLDDAFVCAFITLKPGANATSVLDRLWNIDGLDILVPARGKAYFTESLGFGSYAIPEPTKQMTIANFQTIITSLITTGLFVSASFFSSVRERQWEVGLLKGIGFSPAFIKIELIIEALIVGSISGLLGFTTSFILAVISNTIASGLIPTIFFNMTLSHAAFSVLMSVFLSVLSSYFPALLASDASPIEALRR